MNYLYKIKESKTIYDGYININKNFHILDILVCNLYNKISNWNNVYSVYNDTESYKTQFLNISNFCTRYKNIKSVYNRYKSRWNTPIFLVFPYSIENFSQTTETTNGIKNWLDQYYPTTNYAKNQIISVNIPSLSTDDKNIATMVNLIFRNDDNIWNNITTINNSYIC